MGTLLDTTVFIELERAARERAAADVMTLVAERLVAQLDADQEVGIAAATASELLHGVHRAGERHRAQREAFVEAVLAAFPTLAFDLVVARIHARLWAGLASSGCDVGAHDRLVAATAVSAGWGVATANVRHFNRIPGLEVTVIDMA